MLTPQEVSARSFTKAVMGGYNMTMVDEFLDELTNDYTSLYKENASLKAKMKVLVEKVEEYRATEDSMRATLLAAQRMADSIVKEAEEKRDDVLRQAEAAARETLDGCRKEMDQYSKRLQQGQQEFQRFITESRALCEKELQFLEEFSNAPLVAEEEKESFAVEEIGEKILAAQIAEEAEPPAPETAEQTAQAAPAASAASADQAVPETPAEQASSTEELLSTLAAESAQADLSATRRVNISELKFGPNYRSETD